ncbi:hypothetical protein [Pseudomonas lopnurensis]|uniref:hypothetical protein n=1 Tax=Pseudomonas lopnurensis TaxID=1477517 RepID=UPI00187A96E0|nr:hypothetical protein [Pseudomonas lopnurensis]MBE7377143.1 hypothetical protein [Pseudomonas lopnurensis]
MRNLDFSSWEGLLLTLFGLTVISVIGVGIRLLAMQTIQQRRERENRQINERLRTLIAAYKTLGGSFTGNLEVDPTHLRDLRRRKDDAPAAERVEADAGMVLEPAVSAGPGTEWAGSDRSRRMRDAVEAALSDIILLGTEEQVRLAARAASELVDGRPIHTAELVIHLRDFVRSALDLDPIPTQLSIPKQGPVRPATARGGKSAKDEARQGAGKAGGAGGDGGGAGGMSLGGGLHARNGQDPH